MKDDVCLMTVTLEAAVVVGTTEELEDCAETERRRREEAKVDKAGEGT